MIHISQIKLSITKNGNDLKNKILKILKISAEDILEYRIVKKSIDARNKEDIKYIYNVDVKILKEDKVLKNIKNPNVTVAKNVEYKYVPKGEKNLSQPPYIAGAGPAGLFCALMLAREGYRPVVLERGECIDERIKKVEHYWKTNELDINSNVQFGEGGAGTFSDGKLNTMVNDKSGRIRKVLETFVEAGAPEDILYINKPHIGTDLLRKIVKTMREEIISLGGEIRFGTLLTDVKIEEQGIKEIQINNKEWLPCEVLVLALGHSARDTFTMLRDRKFNMEQKSFAIGVRIEHLQELISKNQYGRLYYKLPAADYKLTHKAVNGRCVYSFCMCPGGFVVNSSSEDNMITVNGMSNHDRSEKNANSAIIVSVTPDDFEKEDVLAGVEFQRKWEGLAYKAGNGCVPVQLFKDFKASKESNAFGNVRPNLKGMYKLANLNKCLPEYVVQALIEGITEFDKKIKGFANGDAVLLGVETRTSSPVRIVRNEYFESNYKGIYPCGEGAGYAGGITSAAMDGIKIFEAVASKYKSF